MVKVPELVEKFGDEDKALLVTKKDLDNALGSTWTDPDSPLFGSDWEWVDSDSDSAED